MLEYINRKINDLKLNKKIILDYRTVAIAFSEELNKESYIDLHSIGIKGVNYYNSENNPPYNISIPGSIKNLFLRKTVALKLLSINDNLRKQGYELYVYDCFRPNIVQHYLWEVWAPDYIRKRHPWMTENEVLDLRPKFTSKASANDSDINLEGPPPHYTGGAVDLTLKKISEEKTLFMGTVFDDFTEASYTDYYEIKKNSGSLNIQEEEALFNRRLLYWTMVEAGFENYPFEWWHFSWGDQMWAILKKEKIAYYSYLKPF
jgi:zinc D-Ala-D-Ala dipeptidase